MAKKDLVSKNLDKRIVERMVARGRVTGAQLDAHLKALPDLESQADNIADIVYQAAGGDGGSDGDGAAS